MNEIKKRLSVFLAINRYQTVLLKFFYLKEPKTPRRETSLPADGADTSVMNRKEEFTLKMGDSFMRVDFGSYYLIFNWKEWEVLFWDIAGYSASSLEYFSAKSRALRCCSFCA